MISTGLLQGGCQLQSNTCELFPHLLMPLCVFVMGCHPYIACLEQAVLTLLLDGGLDDVEISGSSPSVILSGDCLRNDPKLLAEAWGAVRGGLRKEREKEKKR